MKIILASASPRRRELMKIITEDFEAVNPDVDETLPPDVMPEDAAAYLSGIKAKNIAEIYPENIVIGCDTIVLCDGKVLGKPSDRKQCYEFMSMLSGKTHFVITGCTIIRNGQLRQFYEKTAVKFRKLSENEIEEYISTDEPYDKAGGYAIQGRASLFIEKINGDYFNVVGLPVCRLNQELKSMKGIF